MAKNQNNNVAPPTQKTEPEAKKDALATALAQIEKQFGKGAVMKLGDNASMQVDAISTGSLGLDLALGVWKRNRSIMGFSFFVAPLGALMALLFPEPLFSGFSLLMPRIFGYYVTHAILVVCGLSLATLGFYRPDPKDIPRILKTFGLLAVGAHLINLLLRLTLCPEANYFFTYGAEISVLKLFWRIIPVPLLYELPAPLILAGYMYAVCALSRLTQRAEEAPFS